MRKKEKKQTYFQNRNDEYYMPDTNRQGWGSLEGQKTEVTITSDNGTRVITRTPI